MRRDVFWIPALLVGSALYWTVAMRLGSMSVGILGSSCEDLELVPAVTIDVDIVEEPVNVVLEAEEPAEAGEERETYEAEEVTGDPIVVRLQPWVEGTGGMGAPESESEIVSGSVGCVVGGNGVPRGSRPPPVEDSIGRTAF